MNPTRIDNLGAQQAASPWEARLTNAVLLRASSNLYASAQTAGNVAIKSMLETAASCADSLLRLSLPRRLEIAAMSPQESATLFPLALRNEVIKIAALQADASTPTTSTLERKSFQNIDEWREAEALERDASGVEGETLSQTVTRLMNEGGLHYDAARERAVEVRRKVAP